MVKTERKTAKILEDIRSKGMVALQEVYRAYRAEFLAFGRRYQASEEDILDAYQDAIIAFYENVMEGKINHLNSTVKTYLFSIAKYTLINKIKRGQKIVGEGEKELLPENQIENLILENIELNDKQHQLQKALSQLGGKCRELLLLFYYKRYSIEAIMHEMKYSNENTVKANKSRCLKSLKEIFKKGFV